jgi:parallel beta-helix repeat protein
MSLENKDKSPVIPARLVKEKSRSESNLGTTMKSKIGLATALLLLAAVNLQHANLFAQGNLTPPGAPAPTMKSLAQIEPRTPIASLPANISVSGSYYLTTNLAGISGQNGISVNASDVTIDLKGFTLSGVPGSVNGLLVSGSYTNILVRNGTLKNWGYRGLDAEASLNSQYLELRVSDNGDDGMDAGVNSTVIQCVAVNNFWRGIYAADGSVVQACTAADNGNTGISVNAGSTVSDCSSTYNVGGFSAGTGSTVSRCSARGNDGDGIDANQATIVDCTVQANSMRGIVATDGSTVSRCTARANSQDGMLIGTGCRVSDNTCQFNGYNDAGAGIRVYGNQNRIEGNHVVNNDFGIQIQATNNIIIRNSAQSNGTNYVFTGAQIFGPTNNLTDASGAITNSNPWANLSH